VNHDVVIELTHNVKRTKQRVPFLGVIACVINSENEIHVVLYRVDVKCHAIALTLASTSSGSMSSKLRNWHKPKIALTSAGVGT